MPTRTDKVPNTSATAASSGSDLNGAAVQRRLRDAARAPAPRSPRGCSARRRPTSCSSDGRVGVSGRRRARRAVLRGRRPGVPTRACRCSRPASTGRRRSTSTAKTGRGQAVPLLRLRRRGQRGRGRRLHRAVPAAARRHPARRRRLAVAADRSRPGRGRLRPGRRLADDRGAGVGRATAPCQSHGASTYKLPTLGECPPDLQRRAARARAASRA